MDNNPKIKDNVVMSFAVKFNNLKYDLTLCAIY